jgi:hypothetical protein
MPAPPETGYWTGGILYTPPLSSLIDLELGAQDANGTDWVIISVQGMDGAPTSGGVVQRAGDHGAYAPPAYYAGRPITLTVQATANSQALRDLARAALAQVIPVSDLATLRIDEPIPKQLQVRRSGALTETYPTLTDVVFTIGLIAPDPRKYSTVLQSITVLQGSPAAGLAPPLTPPLTLPAGAPPMSASITNNGSFETRPTVSIVGPITGPAIVNQTSGQQVSFSSLTLASTDVLVVDFLNQRALLNGVFRTADLSSSWWVLQPGTATVQVTGTAGVGAQMTVAWRDAWI